MTQKSVKNTVLKMCRMWPWPNLLAELRKTKTTPRTHISRLRLEPNTSWIQRRSADHTYTQTLMCSENISLPGGEAVSFSKYFRTFWRVTHLHLEGQAAYFLDCCTLKMKKLGSVRTSATMHSTKQHWVFSSTTVRSLFELTCSAACICPMPTSSRQSW